MSQKNYFNEKIISILNQFKLYILIDFERSIIQFYALSY